MFDHAGAAPGQGAQEGQWIAAGDESELRLPRPAFAADGLIDSHRSMRLRIEALAEALADQHLAAGYFIEGYARRTGSPRGLAGTRSREMFDLDGALRALDADYWQRAMAMTNIHEILPNARREQWNERISTHATPPFTAENLRATFEELFALRERFVAERADGIFTALSRRHVTNEPQGFGRRMILDGAYSEWGSVDSRHAGIVHDLRAVISLFSGRDAPDRYNTLHVLGGCHRRGQGVWHLLDGGTLRVRPYSRTLHLEVHPDMAWRLNALLHTLHPAAIPASARTRPPRPPRAFARIERALPFALLRILAAANWRAGEVTHLHAAHEAGEAVLRELADVIGALGGTFERAPARATFDYPVDDVIAEVVASGCIPDRISHQFYPTPPQLAARVVAEAGIGEGHAVLEPSAGIGSIALLLPAGRTLCVEVSAMRCRVLAARGLAAEHADFLDWSATTPRRFDRIVMNPPFAGGQARAHVEAAARLLAPGGRLVAILPASMRGKPIAGREAAWSQVLRGAFEHTSAEVAIATLG